MLYEHKIVPACTGVIKDNTGRVSTFTLYVELYNAHQVLKPDEETPASIEMLQPFWTYRVILRYEYIIDNEIMHSETRIPLYEFYEQEILLTRLNVIKFLYNRQESIKIGNSEIKEIITINYNSDVMRMVGVGL